MKIGIAGAGLLGRLLAFSLSQAGHHVSVFDSAGHANDPQAAGFTAAGMLSHVAELESGDESIYALGQRSLQLWRQLVPQWVIPVQLHYQGSLLLAHRGDEGAAQRLVALLSQKAPTDAQPQRLNSEQLRALEPMLANIPNAWALPEEGHIHTRQAMQAMVLSCPTVHWHWQTPIQRLTPHTLHTAKGQALSFDWVFDTRGLGARERPFANPYTLSCQNVRGVRGEVFWLETREATPLLSRPIRLLHPRYRVYMVPRQPNLIVVGASEIESEDRSPVSLRSTLELLAAAHSVLPALSEARIVHSESNLRPALLDNFPRIETQEGLCRINGLFRHGWLIAPALVEKALQSILSPSYVLGQQQ